MTVYIMSKRDFESLEIAEWLSDNLQPGDYTLGLVPNAFDDKKIAQARDAISRQRERGADATSWERLLASRIEGRDDRPQLTLHTDEAAVLFSLRWDGDMVLLKGGE